jgi:hypothetical protein
MSLSPFSINESTVGNNISFSNNFLKLCLTIWMDFFHHPQAKTLLSEYFQFKKKCFWQFFWSDFFFLGLCELHLIMAFKKKNFKMFLNFCVGSIILKQLKLVLKHFLLWFKNIIYRNFRIFPSSSRKNSPFGLFSRLFSIFLNFYPVIHEKRSQNRSRKMTWW